MTERELLRKAAKTDPVARLAYADWLIENDELLLASVYRMSAESLSELHEVIAETVSPTKQGYFVISARQWHALRLHDALMNPATHDAALAEWRRLFGDPNAPKPQGVIRAVK